MSVASDWYSEESATFGDRLAGARDATGMSQSELAKRLGVKVKTVRNWENDLAEPRANKVSMLSGVLNVSLTWLLTGNGEGLDGPGDMVEIPANLGEVLTELRQMRAEMERGAARVARLEKRLRTALEAEL